MAKLTLSFKGLLIAIYDLGDEPATIGRNLDCQIVIDSLAIGPRHALISVHPDGYSIAAVDPDHPTLVNNEQIRQAPLHHGDLIQVGKHTLHFSESAQDATPVLETPGKAAHNATETDHLPSLPDLAYVQVQNGPQIGRILAIPHEGTHLPSAGVDQVTIARRGDGYVLTCENLAGETSIYVNGMSAPSDVEVPLPHTALIEIGDLRFRFFHGDA